MLSNLISAIQSDLYQAKNIYMSGRILTYFQLEMGRSHPRK
jgi:hypothetical protein